MMQAVDAQGCNAGRDSAPLVLVNRPEYLADFIRLNEAWITQYFQLEAADFALARNPSKVIDDGGFVFTLLIEDEVVGVCALFRDADGGFQLARMAVAPPYQGRGFGNLLLQAALEKLRDIKVGKVTLLTNSRLTTALALYRKHGFRVVREGLHPDYARVDIVMERQL